MDLQTLNHFFLFFGKIKMYSEYFRFLLLQFTVAVLCFHGACPTTFNDVRRLHAYLTEYIDADIRPINNQSETLYVDLIPVLISLHGLDEKKQVFSSTFAMQLSWKYETLTWKSSDFGGVEDVMMSPCSLWTPDITFDNAFRESNDINKCIGPKISITNDGMAIWHIGEDLNTACNVDIRKYPFDTQICKIVLGKSIYYDTQQSVKTATNKLVLSMTDDNNEWLITDTNIKYTIFHEDLTYIDIYIVLERRYLFYVLNVIIPVVMLSMMNVFSFKLPSSSGERISYNISLLLTYIVLLNMISDSVPRVSKYISYLQLYIIVQFTLAISISILSITVVRMENDKYKTKIPQFVKILFKIFLRRGQKVNLETENNTEHDHAEQIDNYKDLDIKDIKGKTGTVDDGRVHSEDPTLVQFLDNLCFWTFMCFFVISTTTCLLAMNM